MLMIVRSPRAFGWGTSYELQLFRDGHWLISAVFHDRREALEEAHRLDRSGKLVRLRADEIDDSGKSRGTRTVFLSSPIKKTWKAERERIAQRERRHPIARMDDDDRGHPINPYVLLAIFTAIAFSGLAAIFALRSLYDAV